MLGHEGETPSRYELLNMVKKHSNSLGQTELLMDQQQQDGAPDDVELDQLFWHDILDLYFVRGKESRGRQDDDLLFFIRKLGSQGYGFNDNLEAIAPYFVRRWAPKLDTLVGESSVEVDWRRSFYLNLIAHTTFTVTVAICSHEDLRNHQSGQDKPLSPIYKHGLGHLCRLLKRFMHPQVVSIFIWIPKRQEVETTPAYPDICFAVDDFDSTFDAVVLTEIDHCYCVLLNAHGGAAFPSEDAHCGAASSSEKESQDSSSSDTSSLRVDTNSGKTKNTKLTLFSGFVSYQMVRDAYDGTSSYRLSLSLV
uniref:Uncharacterized protein n=1 Tax=Quercus lobata TaxID=97700 RepID=A0A7N2RF39_QUELO